MTRVILLIALASLLQGCKSAPAATDRAITPIGRWSIPSESSDAETYGVELLEDGRARSINLVSQHYEEWRLEGDTLVLTGVSVEDDAEECFSETVKVLTLTRTKMVLQHEGFILEMDRIQE